MNAQLSKNKKGFTIIEVVLVLAIAALIFLMVFIALPALQRNQRDTARKTVLGKVASSMTSYQSNNRGANPSNVNLLSGYVDDTNPAADKVEVDNEYSVLFNTPAPTTPGYGSAATDVVQIFGNAKCGSDDKAVPGTKRQAAVIIQLENGDDFICQEV